MLKGVFTAKKSLRTMSCAEDSDAGEELKKWATTSVSVNDKTAGTLLMEL